MDTIFDRTAALIDAIGSQHFPMELLNFFAPTLGIISCIAYEWAGDKRPSIIALASPSMDHHYLTLAGDHWQRKGYKVDPVVALLNDSGASAPSVDFVNIPSIPRLHRAQSELITELYDHSKLGEEAIIWMKDKEHTTTVSFHRSDRAPTFEASEREHIQQLAGIIMSSVRRHAEFQTSLARTYSAAGKEDALTLEKSRKRLQFRSLLRSRCRELTDRETDVCAYIIIGHSKESIALLLDISPSTVATHRRNAYLKLGISAQNQLFDICWQH